jgi:ribonuclease-3
LERALTHSSLSGTARGHDLERLEFLGDRVLGILAAEALYRRFPEMTEGELAPRLNALVRKETCAKAALAWGLDQHVRMSSHEDAAGGRRKAAILGDVAEALLGAIYLDGGLEAARRAYELFWTPHFDELSEAHRDPKTSLQEWTQERRRGTPDYVVVASGGPAHAPAFDVEVRIEGFAAARGTGRSKREAQTEAARAFLLREKIWTEDE